MSKKFSFIINALILILIVILVAFMMNYYAKGSKLVPTSQNPSTTSSGDKSKEENKGIITIPNSGEVAEKNATREEQPDDRGIPSEGPSEDVVAPTSEPNEENQQSTDKTQEDTTTNEPEAQNTNFLPKENTPEKQETSSKNDQPTSPVIITSENEISSKEKREILSELDQTLMELLDVVDKVQIVDESRLPTDSEVQKP